MTLLLRVQIDRRPARAMQAHDAAAARGRRRGADGVADEGRQRVRAVRAATHQPRLRGETIQVPWTDRLTGGQTDRQTDRQTPLTWGNRTGATYRQTDGQTDGQINSQGPEATQALYGQMDRFPVG
jgi:hypothetical protein